MQIVEIGKKNLKVGQSYKCEWLDLNKVDSKKDDLRKRGKKKAVQFLQEEKECGMQMTIYILQQQLVEKVNLVKYGDIVIIQ